MTRLESNHYFFRNRIRNRCSRIAIRRFRRVSENSDSRHQTSSQKVDPKRGGKLSDQEDAAEEDSDYHSDFDFDDDDNPDPSGFHSGRWGFEQNRRRFEM